MNLSGSFGAFIFTWVGIAKYFLWLNGWLTPDYTGAHVAHALQTRGTSERNIFLFLRGTKTSLSKSLFLKKRQKEVPPKEVMLCVKCKRIQFIQSRDSFLIIFWTSQMGNGDFVSVRGIMKFNQLNAYLMLPIKTDLTYSTIRQGCKMIKNLP